MKINKNQAQTLYLSTWGCGVAILLTMLISASCDSESEALLEVDRPGVTSDETFLARRFSTGRDSFGVALKASISGTTETDPDGRCPEDVTVLLSGAGQVTHMGRIQVRQSHCLDPSSSEITDGEFIYVGKDRC